MNFGDTDEQATERERMKLLLANFDEQQMSRYEAFRRANISRSAVRRYANQVLNQSVTANVSLILSGVSKVLVGDLVERARDLQSRELSAQGVVLSEGEEPPPLKPSHFHEAWRLYKLETGSIPGSRGRVGDAGRLFK